MHKEERFLRDLRNSGPRGSLSYICMDCIVHVLTTNTRVARFISCELASRAIGLRSLLITNMCIKTISDPAHCTIQHTLWDSQHSKASSSLRDGPFSLCRLRLARYDDSTRSTEEKAKGLAVVRRNRLRWHQYAGHLVLCFNQDNEFEKLRQAIKNDVSSALLFSISS